MDLNALRNAGYGVELAAETPNGDVYRVSRGDDHVVYVNERDGATIQDLTNAAA